MPSTSDFNGHRLFLGIDLAWKPVKRTGLAVVDDAGRLVASGTAISDDDIDAWISSQDGTVVVAAVDAPLVVPNETGQRAGETELARAYGKYSAGPYSSSKQIPYFDPPRAEVLAKRLVWSVDPANHGTVEQPACIEVYPHPAMVALFSLPQRILYKKGAARAQGFTELVTLFESLSSLRLAENARWQELCNVISAPKPGDLDRAEDEIDAILCAHLAWLWHHQPDSLQVYGSLATGYIVAPPPPSHPAVRSSASRQSTTQTTRPGTSRSLAAAAAFVPGRPTAFAGGAPEATWKSSIREAFEGFTVPQGSRVGVEFEFVLDGTARANPDLDNLLKASIDALDCVLGPQPGEHANHRADNERVDRIVASKHKARPGEPTGARIVISELSPAE